MLCLGQVNCTVVLWSVTTLNVAVEMIHIVTVAEAANSCSHGHLALSGAILHNLTVKRNKCWGVVLQTLFLKTSLSIKSQNKKNKKFGCLYITLCFSIETCPHTNCTCARVWRTHQHSLCENNKIKVMICSLYTDLLVSWSWSAYQGYHAMN